MYKYTTIEPRLIALPNSNPTDLLGGDLGLDLPPLQDPNALRTSRRPSPLEPSASARGSKSSSAPQQNVLFELEVPNETLTTVLSEGPTKRHSAARALGSTSPQSLRKILDDDPETFQTSANKKRQRIDGSNDDFVQLPQLPKKQKAAKQVVPPIINGLFDPPPPPNAALFPPIASSSFYDSKGRNSLNAAPPSVRKLDFPEKAPAVLVEKLELATPSKARKSNWKPRKKWSEDETKHMLLGVSRHGIGNWTKILNDPEFNFNNRKAVDLKDRFRTCCPLELRGSVSKSGEGLSEITSGEKSAGKQKSKSSLMTENILIDTGYASSEYSSNDDVGPGKSGKSEQKRRAHRKNLDDLAKIGIKGPFQKSKRRERRAFSEDEDTNILQGFHIYGPQWTLISKDPKLGLESRRPTDIRDRLRNKFPEIYFADEESRKIVKDTSNGVALPNPSMNPRVPDLLLNQERVLPLSAQGFKLHHQQVNSSYAPKEYFSDILGSSSGADGLPFSQTLEWSENLVPFAGNINEMDISRLLLDESWPHVSPVKEKQNYAEINGGGPANTSLPQYDPIYDATGISTGWDTSQVINLPFPIRKE